MAKFSSSLEIKNFEFGLDRFANRSRRRNGRLAKPIVCLCERLAKQSRIHPNLKLNISGEVAEWMKSKLFCFSSDFCEAKNFPY